MVIQITSLFFNFQVLGTCKGAPASAATWHTKEATTTQRWRTQTRTGPARTDPLRSALPGTPWTWATEPFALPPSTVFRKTPGMDMGMSFIFGLLLKKIIIIFSVPYNSLTTAYKGTLSALWKREESGALLLFVLIWFWVEELDILSDLTNYMLEWVCIYYMIILA